MRTTSFMAMCSGTAPSAHDPPGMIPGSNGPPRTAAVGIDDLGRIVGFYDGSDGVHHGYIFDSGAFRDVDFPGAFATGAQDINDLKRIVGGYIEANGLAHGFLQAWGVFTSFDFPGAAGTRAQGINILGHIVGGWSDDPDCPVCSTHAFLLTPHGFQNLEVPGALETVAFGINDLGQIVGSYFGEDEVLHGYVRDRDRNLEDDGND